MNANNQDPDVIDSLDGIGEDPPEDPPPEDSSPSSIRTEELLEPQPVEVDNDVPLPRKRPMTFPDRTIAVPAIPYVPGEQTILERAAGSQALRGNRARDEAGMLYITSPESLTIEQVQKDPRFTKLSLTKIKYWASEDKWVERRKAFYAQWAEITKQKLGKKLMQARLEEYDRLIELRRQADEQLISGEVMARSWEGVAKIRLDVGKRLDELAIEVTNELAPKEDEKKAGADSEAAALKELSASERDAVIEFILERRRQQSADELKQLQDGREASDKGGAPDSSNST